MGTRRMSEKEGDKVRNELLVTITRLSTKFPSLRICQLVGNSLPAMRWTDVYYIEDSELLQYLLQFEKKVGGG